jgi:predicted membrane protein
MDNKLATILGDILSLVFPTGGTRHMDGLPTWAWWVVVAGLLLSPIFAFLSALLVEIFIEVLKEGGLTALVTLMAAGLLGRLLLRKFWVRSKGGDIVEDQA